ncbi:hypothetical protein MASR2M117_23370 [Paludibacter sp.]
MLYGKPYKGFGISAQSMNSNGISYNIGKNSKDLTNVINCDNYTEEYTYILPKQELLSKYIAISGYYGRFSLITATEILGIDSKQFFYKKIEFCLNNELLTLDNDFLHITQKGYRNYGAVFSLFYKKTREKQIKKYSRAKKLNLINTKNPTLKELNPYDY